MDRSPFAPKDFVQFVEHDKLTHRSGSTMLSVRIPNSLHAAIIRRLNNRLHPGRFYRDAFARGLQDALGLNTTELSESAHASPQAQEPRPSGPAPTYEPDDLVDRWRKYETQSLEPRAAASDADGPEAKWGF